MPDELTPQRGVSVRDAERMARDLAASSLSEATIRTYRIALRQVDEWLAEQGCELDDRALSVFLGAQAARGKTPAWGDVICAAVRFRATEMLDIPNPAGRRTRRVMAGWRRTSARERTPKQAAAMLADDVARILRAAPEPRKGETPDEAAARAREDIAIVGLSFYGGLRRSEISRVRASDVEPSADGSTCAVRLRYSKTNPDGGRPDTRLVKGLPALALAELALLAHKAGTPDAALLPYCGRTVARRIRAAGLAAGITKRLTGHSGRVGLASELTARGASTAEVMLAGGWKTESMVARYSAGAKVQRGAVARLL